MSPLKVIVNGGNPQTIGTEIQRGDTVEKPTEGVIRDV